MSSSVFETGAELLWRAVFGFWVEVSVCATTLVVIRSESAKASGRFIFSPEFSVGQMNYNQFANRIVETNLYLVCLGSSES
jgi:hypothetical protein